MNTSYKTVKEFVVAVLSFQKQTEDLRAEQEIAKLATVLMSNK